jgi:hypothetical protein
VTKITKSLSRDNEYQLKVEKLILDNISAQNKEMHFSRLAVIMKYVLANKRKKSITIERPNSK